MANYSWILMEGIYLHNLIFMALFLDTSSIMWHVTLGWTLPAIFVTPWAIIRATYEDTFCWTTNTNKLHFLIIRIPTVVSIIVSVFSRSLNDQKLSFFKIVFNIFRSTFSCSSISLAYCSVNSIPRLPSSYIGG